ncbi:MAG: hypothetical protein CL402_00245 [Acidiferrobacteraceae bacterium]|nr:hypothetical protein [Acidiferrobacteraceae bacterium]
MWSRLFIYLSICSLDGQIGGIEIINQGGGPGWGFRIWKIIVAGEPLLSPDRLPLLDRSRWFVLMMFSNSPNALLPIG